MIKGGDGLGGPPELHQQSRATDLLNAGSYRVFSDGRVYRYDEVQVPRYLPQSANCLQAGCTFPDNIVVNLISHWSLQASRFVSYTTGDGTPTSPPAAALVATSVAPLAAGVTFEVPLADIRGITIWRLGEAGGPNVRLIAGVDYLVQSLHDDAGATTSTYAVMFPQGLPAGAQVQFANAGAEPRT